MAIKGKTKRSQGRPVRRPATAPRIPVVERRQPWYRAPAFQVTIALVVLVVTLGAAYNRTQRGWSRDDVRRFTSALRVQTDRLTPILGAGTKDAPGMATAGDLISGKVKPADFQARAATWSTRIGAIGQKVANVTVGKPEAVTTFNGTPPNSVGGHVPLLTSVRDAYSTAFGFYAQAATAYQQAAGAPVKSQLAQKLVTQAQSDQTKAAQAMDSAASFLARILASYDLNVQQPLPGESSTAFGNRTGAVQAPSGGAGLPAGAGG